jgi:mRNA-degrading endonuclease RelE of RelBE toxin-antitoxin system
MYKLKLREKTKKVLRKLSKKNKKQFFIVNKKINEIRTNPFHEYKFLRKPFQNINRVHIDNHFVLMFKIYHEKEEVEIVFFGHHDEAYKKIK